MTKTSRQFIQFGEGGKMSEEIKEQAPKEVGSQQKILALEPLDEKNIQYKVDRYLKNGHTLQTMKQSIEKEMFAMTWDQIRLTIQLQSFKEQLSYLDRLIKQEETNAG